MLTIFASPRPFKGHIAVIQRNAIASWLRLEPRPEVILFGDVEGTLAVCNEFGLQYAPEVATTEFGTPLLDDLVQKAKSKAANNLLCYINSDIILMSSFSWAVHMVTAWNSFFLMTGGRWELDIGTPLDFGPTWEPELSTLVRTRARFALFGNDYFVFPKTLFTQVPPLAIGRVPFDFWFIWEAKSLKAKIIDSSPTVMAVHQNHDYSYAPWKAEETKRNWELVPFSRPWWTLEATHKLTTEGFKRQVPLARKAWRLCQEIPADFAYRLGVGRLHYRKRIREFFS